MSIPNIEVHNLAIQYTETGLGDAFDSVGVPLDFEVLFFDIDGGEYQMLNGLYPKYRPKFVCVEYDNAYPLSIDYIPREIRHGRQASSIAFFKMMRDKGYNLLKSFSNDHIFIDAFFAEENSLSCPTFNEFVFRATENLYQYDKIFLCQNPNRAGDGIAFLSSKLDALIEDGFKEYAKSFYCEVARNATSCLGFLSSIGKRQDDYSKNLEVAICQFMKRYSSLID